MLFKGKIMSKEEEIERIVDKLTDVERCECGGELIHFHQSRVGIIRQSVCASCNDVHLNGKKVEVEGISAKYAIQRKDKRR